MKKSLLIFSACALIFASCSKTPEGSVGEQSIESAEGDKVLIRLKPKVGDTQKTLMTMDMSADGEQKISMNMSMAMDLKVTDLTAAVYTYEVKYDKIKMDMDAGGMQMNYDSSAKEQTGMGQMMHEQMKVLLDKTLSMKMNERGKITEFNMPGMGNNQQMDMGSISLPMPEEPVGVGDSWSDERSIQGSGNMKMTMTVEKITVDDIIIGVKGTIEGNVGEAAGDFTGNYKLARSNGFTKDGTINMNITAEGMPMKIKINVKPLS
ncbi:DUF6263 family protein [Moheibacter sediminis]|uniref:Lipoprotein n=1 Tax=Moheibacter sediminis TaxID=1434700 RepID=A0A1W1YAF4_9FLAO|nr:DUF6263 family protein [Moheibacter sediminis]SMC32801.1 hypothetical protein SAMN06296427_101136 [Moheibacter sediminis]